MAFGSLPGGKRLANSGSLQMSPGNQWNPKMPTTSSSSAGQFGYSGAPSFGGGGPNPFGVPAPSAEQNKYNNIIGTTIGNYAPEISKFRSTNDLLKARGGMDQAKYDTDAGNLRTNYSLDSRGFDLDTAELGISRQSNARDAAYYDKLLAMMPQYRGLSKQELDQTIATARTNAATQQRGINSDFTSRGAFLAPFRRMDIADSETARLAQENSANIGYARDMLGLDEKELGLGRSRGGVDDDNAKLDLAAQRVGLSREKLKANLDQGLANLGYDNFLTASQLTEMIDSNDLAQADLARKIWAEVLAAGAEYNNGGLGDIYSQMFG